MTNRPWILTLLAVGFVTAAAVAQEVPPLQGTSTLVYIGTHTSDKGKGIYLFRLQSAGTDVFQNVTLVPVRLVASRFRKTSFVISRSQSGDGPGLKALRPRPTRFASAREPTLPPLLAGLTELPWPAASAC